MVGDMSEQSAYQTSADRYVARKSPANRDPTPSVIGVGWTFQEILVQLPAYPAENTKTPVSRVRYEVGGPVARALLALSRLASATRLGLVAALGDDEGGRFVAARLKQYGVSLLTPRRKDEPTRTSTVWLVSNAGSRTVAYDASPRIQHKFPDGAAAMLTSPRDVLHLDGRDRETAVAACRHARDVGAHVVLDVGTFRPSTVDILGFANTIISPAASLGPLLDTSDVTDVPAAARKLLSRHCSRVFVTSGTDDAVAISETETTSLKPFAVQAIDSNGAGDVFAAGVIVGTLRSMPLHETLQLAAAAAAIKCTTLGNDDLPTLDDVLEFVGTRAGTRG